MFDVFEMIVMVCDVSDVIDKLVVDLIRIMEDLGVIS